MTGDRQCGRESTRRWHTREVEGDGGGVEEGKKRGLVEVGRVSVHRPGRGRTTPIEKKMMNMMEERERMMESLLLSLLLSLSQPQWEEAKRPERTRDRQAS